MGASTTFVTATYAKPYMLVEAAFSVFAQIRQDWEWWIVLNGPIPETEAVAYRLADMDSRVKIFEEETSHERRFKEYMPAVIVNKYYPLIKTPFFSWFSDDDLLDACFVQQLAGFLEKNPDKDIVYGHCEGIKVGGRGQWKRKKWILAKRPLGKGTGIDPDCKIDSGQIMQTKRSYNALNGYQLPTSWQNASHVDGIYMSRLARDFTFWPLGVRVVIHRNSHQSTFVRG
jgi:hypothetical protein